MLTNGNTCLASLFLLCRIILATRIHSLFYFRHDVLNFTKSPLRLWLEFCCISRPNWNNFIFIILNFHIRIMGTSPSIEVFFDALHEFCISFHKSSAHLWPEYFKESFIGFVIIAKIRIFFFLLHFLSHHSSQRGIFFKILRLYPTTLLYFLCL